MPGSFATTAIITKGLYGGSACKGLITTNFSLFCNITPPQAGSGGGGPYPGIAWNKFEQHQDIYTPVEQPFLPREQEAELIRRKLTIVLRIDIKDIHIEKIYVVAEKRHGSIIKIFNLINVTQKRFLLAIYGIKIIATKAKAIITNLKLK